MFAGADIEATERARSYFTGYPPSSPSIALMRDGKLLWMLERRNIENQKAEMIAKNLTDAFDKVLRAGNRQSVSALPASRVHLEVGILLQARGGHERRSIAHCKRSSAPRSDRADHSLVTSRSRSS